MHPMVMFIKKLNHNSYSLYFYMHYNFISLEKVPRPKSAPDQDWVPIKELREQLHHALNFSKYSLLDICSDIKYNSIILSQICTNDIKISINKSKKILNSFSQNTEISLNSSVNLPSFSVDKSELFLGGLIERVAHSYDLYITTFLINTQLIDMNSKIEITKESLMTWSKVFLNAKEGSDASYDDVRKDVFYCKIKNTHEGESYLVQGD
jgi:hypothetical protein